MVNEDESFLLLSGLQHFCFCKRQWALIHVEQQWQENALTLEGHALHERVHDADFTEKRGSVLLSRGMPVRSETLQITGNCDLVEMTQDPAGVPIAARDGRWRLYPVEYKHGREDIGGAGALQLCAQAMCLEEMFCTDIPEGAIYFAAAKHRKGVPFTQELRQKVRDNCEEMHRLFLCGQTPRCKPTSLCKSCSLRELCQPQTASAGSAKAYVNRMLAEEEKA